MSLPRCEIAVLLPCFNEEAAIGDVVASFRTALPEAKIFVYDNGSTDGTVRAARAAGAIVKSEPARGKGNAVRRAFADVSADIYILADGDGTYDASAAPAMINMLWSETLDMVVGVRATSDEAAYRAGHELGNKAFSFLFRRLFRSEFTDILSGYRVFSRRFVKSFPSQARGFEIEIEMSSHAALMRLPVREYETAYAARPEGSESKLNTISDGLRIFRRMLRFLRSHRPRLVYVGMAMVLAIVAAVLMVPIVIEYFATGLVPRFPTLILAVSVMLSAVVLVVVGVILNAQARYFAETKRLAYLSIPPPAGDNTK